MAREIGVSNITLFPVENDTPTQIQYGGPVKLPWAVTLETTNIFAESAYYADNITERASKVLTGIEIALEVSSNTPPALDAQITGKKYKDGMAFSEGSANQPLYAVAYSILMDDGNERRRVIYKTGLSRNGQTNETVSDGITAQTYTYEGVASAVISNSRFDAYMDKKEIDAMPDGNQNGNDDEREQFRAKQAAIKAWNEFFDTPQGHAVK